jgi:hypothetical protein
MAPIKEWTVKEIKVELSHLKHGWMRDLNDLIEIANSPEQVSLSHGEERMNAEDRKALRDIIHALQQLNVVSVWPPKAKAAKAGK